MNILKYIFNNIYLLGFILLILGILSFGAIIFVVKKVTMYKNMTRRKIKPRKTTVQQIKEEKRKEVRNTWFNFIINKYKDDNLELKLIHSGNVFGIKDVSGYVLYKGIFAIAGIILGLELFDKHFIMRSLCILILTTILGFSLLDFIIKQSTQSREKKINKQLPDFLLYFDNYNKAGLSFDDILSTISNILHGELKKEVIRFNINYSMTKDFENSLAEFIKRLGSSESDSVEVKLRQCFFSGIYEDVLSDEKEIIDKKVINDIAKETKQYEVYLAISMCLLVTNLFLWLVYPMLILIQENMIVFK